MLPFLPNQATPEANSGPMMHQKQPSIQIPKLFSEGESKTLGMLMRKLKEPWNVG